ncbi:7-cyano-7-deazaguanine synthase QueC [Buchnera aphidicola]|uniref:7-cyano-7-deazaguanine synthase QueC n=1 Tax=Buchnera aphidicola TaxID=9 RepID=UPI003463A791
MKKKSKALVIFSGGQDSTTCLIQARKKYEEVHAITFNYGQRHQQEIKVAVDLIKIINIYKHKIINISNLNKLFLSSLTNKNLFSKKKKNNFSDLPDTFVPGRNILFLILSSIYSYNHNIQDIILGVNQIDFSGYPDCRSEFINSINSSIKLGMSYPFLLKTPLINLNKSEIWALSDFYNQTSLIMHYTLTCYNGIKGKGCDKCKACQIRNTGYKEWKQDKKFFMKSLKSKIKLD